MDAITRRVNQTIIDALKKTTTKNIGSATTNLTVATLTDIKEIFDDLGIPDEDRFIMHTAQQLRNLLNETKMTSSDFTDVKALVDGKLKQYLGFNFRLIPRVPEGGLPKGVIGTDKFQLGFAYHKRSIGFASPVGGEIATSKDWIPTKKAWQINATVDCGAVIIDNDGVVPFMTKFVTK